MPMHRPRRCLPHPPFAGWRDGTERPTALTCFSTASADSAFAAVLDIFPGTSTPNMLSGRNQAGLPHVARTLRRRRVKRATARTRQSDEPKRSQAGRALTGFRPWA